MAKKNNRYRIMEQYMTCGLIGDTALFGLYLLCAGLGVLWLKFVLSILILSISGLCLAFLYLSREFLQPRSLWMTTGAAAIIVCLLISLLLNYPCPAL